MVTWALRGQLIAFVQPTVCIGSLPYEEECSYIRYVAYIMLTRRTCRSRDIVFILLFSRS